MKLDRLSLRSFRQFRDADIEFARHAEQNVTVIHGQNGSGKTTIRNSFLWLLYDEMQSVKRPDRVAHQGEMVAAEVGDTVTVEVELVFEHEGAHHEARRRKTYQKQSEDDRAGMEVDASFSVEYLADDGHVEAPSNPETYIRQIVPRDLSDLFFFDGEYISDLSGVDNQEEIQEAIRQMMGLTIMERSITHLEWVEGEFRDELHDLGSDELQELIQRRDDLEQSEERKERKLEDKKRKKHLLQSEIEDIGKLLSQVGKARELQEQRERLQTEREDRIDETDELNKEIESLLSETGFLTFALQAIQETAEDLDELREQGKIPSKLDNQLIEELLSEGTCICGRSLPEGSSAAQSVENYKSDISTEGVDQASIQLIDKLDRIREEHGEFFNSVDDLLERRTELNSEIEELNGRIDDVGTEIGEVDESVENLDVEDISFDEINLDTVESISDLEATRAAKQELIDEELTEDIILLGRELEELAEDIGALEDEIDDAEDEKREADLVRKRMQASKAVRAELETYYDKFQQSIRKRANDHVDETFDQVATRDYEAVITEEFELRIRDRHHGTPVEVDKSRGERQIASLSFIGSLVDIACEQYESDRDTEYFDGGIYPILMDSPFGALDNEHRTEVSKVLPMLADQVAVLVTDSQWEGPVQREMGPSVGVHYRLKYDQEGGINGSPITDVVEQSRHDLEVARR